MNQAQPLQSKQSYSRKSVRGAFDFETWEWVNPRCAGFVWGNEANRQKKIFIDYESKAPESVTRSALLFMASKPDNVTTWFGHNAGKFDSLFLLQGVHALGWRAKCHIAGGRIISLEINGPRGKFKIHDSYAIVQSNLKKAAQDFQLKSSKLLGEEDYSLDVREWTIDRLTEGCLTDCEIVLQLLEVVEKLFEDHGGKLKTTFSSSALSVVKANSKLAFQDFTTSKELINVNSAARKSFNGGRVEVFRHSPQYLLREWDINSSYPASMAMKLPWEFIKATSGRAASEWYENDEFCGTVEATVSVQDDYLPVLPYRDEDNSGIFFPTGEWRGHFDSDELRYAEQNGATILSVHNMWVYSRESPFTQFINEFYEHKSKAKGAAREFYKLCLNGCYGKFAQKPENEEIVILESEDIAHDLASNPLYKNRIRFINSADSRFVAIDTIKWPKHTHYALASAITAQSRIALHKYLRKAKRIAYCDTDSVHAEKDETCLASFENNSLGGLKIELDNYYGLFAAAKIYGLFPTQGKPHFASKGFPVNEETWRKVVSGEVIKTERMQLAKKQMRRNNRVERPTTERSWHGISAKRRPIGGPDGDTLPWKVEELRLGAHLKARSPVATFRSLLKKSKS